MIPGDFLYTNYPCRIALLLYRDFYSDYEPNGDYAVLNLRGKEIFFRRNGNNFVLVNQYGEKRILKSTKALMKILIAKALKDSGEEFREIKINGEDVDVSFEDLKAIGEVLEYLRILDMSFERGMSQNTHCNVPCPFKKYCDDEVNPSKIGEINRENESSQLLIYSSLVDLFLGSDILSTAINLVERYINDSNNFRKRVKEVTARLTQEMGYENADTVMWIGKRVVRGEKVKDIELNLEDYNGYLTKEGKWIIPSDRFWNLVYGEGKVEKIRELYKIWGD